jgi:hypothetical protein
LARGWICTSGSAEPKPTNANTRIVGMSAIVTLLSRNGRRRGTGRGVNSLGKKDVGCAADGVVAETLDGGAERMQQRFAQRARVINQQGLRRRARGSMPSVEHLWATRQLDASPIPASIRNSCKVASRKLLSTFLVDPTYVRQIQRSKFCLRYGGM